jgi:hypothetical protein
MVLEDLNKYTDEWTRTQLMIWREKIERMKIVRTGALHESFTDTINRSAEGTTITMKFARYGIFQAMGVGRGYVHGNGGDLEFLDKDYREEHGLNKPRKVGPAWGDYMTSGKPRVARDWMTKKLYMSTMAMVEDVARITGETVARVICETLSDPHSALK